jgi:hypothetical protein
MPYSQFTLKQVTREFGLQEQVVSLFPADVTLVEPSAWLAESLKKGQKLALISEKVRSEVLVMPFLIDLKERNQDRFAVFSGAFLDVQPSRGLNGECDFILTLAPNTVSVTAPIFTIVEAKKNDLDMALGQCAGQLVGARLYNEADGTPIDSLYGCVTTGTDWRFLKLHHNDLLIDSTIYYINEPNRLLGILQFITDQYLGDTIQTL